MASTVCSPRNAQILGQHRCDVQSTARLAHEIARQTRMEREAGAAVQHMQNGRLSAQINGNVDVPARMANHVSEKFAQDEFRVCYIRLHRSPMSQHFHNLRAHPF